MSDLCKYCVHIGASSSKRWFLHFKLCCMRIYRAAVMAVGVGILYNSGDFPIFYFVLLAINVCQGMDVGLPC